MRPKCWPTAEGPGGGGGGLAKQFEAIQSRRNEVTRLAGVRDTAQAHRDRVLEVSKSRANLVQRAADAAVDGQSSWSRRWLARFPHVNRSRIGSARHSRRSRLQGSGPRGRDRPASSHRHRDYQRQQIELDQLSERRERVRTPSVAARRPRRPSTRARSTTAGRAYRGGAVEVAKAEASQRRCRHSQAEAWPTSVEIDGRAVCSSVPGSTRTVVAGSAEVVVPGTIGIVVKAGAEAQVLADRLAEAACRFRVGVRWKGISPAWPRLAGLRRLATERATVASLETAKSIEQDLRDLTPKHWPRRSSDLTARIASYRAERPAEPPCLPPELDSAQMLASSATRTPTGSSGGVERLEEDLARSVSGDSGALISVMPAPGRASNKPGLRPIRSNDAGRCSQGSPTRTSPSNWPMPS